MVECHLAKVDVEGSSPFSRSTKGPVKTGPFSFREPVSPPDQVLLVLPSCWEQSQRFERGGAGRCYRKRMPWTRHPDYPELGDVLAYPVPMGTTENDPVVFEALDEIGLPERGFAPARRASTPTTMQLKRATPSSERRTVTCSWC